MPHQTEITSLNSPGQFAVRHIATKKDSLFVKLALCTQMQVDEISEAQASEL